jgi:hypothetical protein
MLATLVSRSQTNTERNIVYMFLDEIRVAANGTRERS